MKTNVFNMQDDFNRVIREQGFLGSLIVSNEGLIIQSSKVMPDEIKVDTLAAKAAAIFSFEGVLHDEPDNIVINYSGMKVFIRKVTYPNQIYDFILLIMIMNPSERCFLRRTNKIANNIGLFSLS